MADFVRNMDKNLCGGKFAMSKTNIVFDSTFTSSDVARRVLAISNRTQKFFASKMQMTPQTFSYKLKTDSFTLADLQMMATAGNCQVTMMLA